MTEEFIAMRKNNKLVGWNEYCDTSYAVSKVLLNAYGRWVVTKLISANQSVFMVDPGWYLLQHNLRCKTDMGTEEAPLQPEDGIICMMHLIKAVPFGRDEKLSG